MMRVYLLHFSRPVGAARHYIGQTTRSVDARLAEHRAGRAARLTRRAIAQGVELVVARIWEDVEPHKFERALKRRGGAKHFCPVCKAHADLPAPAQAATAGATRRSMGGR